MPSRTSSLIHATAIVMPGAQLADDVRVGPFAVIERDATIAAGTTIGPHTHILGRVTLGERNEIGTGVVIGAAPQHLGYKGEPTEVAIGDGNIFREYATVHRAMPAGSGHGAGVTRVGNRNIFMVNSHVAHDCVVGDECMFANGAVIGGHVTVGDRVLLSGNTAVHQFCRVGRVALLSGTSATSMDIPPFWIIRDVNRVCGINAIGMRRAGIPPAEIQAVRRAFAIIYVERLPISAALVRIEAELGQFAAIRELVEFIRASKRGIAGPAHFRGAEDAAA